MSDEPCRTVHYCVPTTRGSECVEPLALSGADADTC
jgi:hypothetical protein